MAQLVKSNIVTNSNTTLNTTTTNANEPITLQGIADQTQSGTESPYRDWEFVNDEKISLLESKQEKSRQEDSFTLKSEKMTKRRLDPNYYYVEGEIPLESVIISSTLASKNNQHQVERIVAKFNEGIDTSKVYYDDPV
jgi:hypothetical protein